MYQNIGDSYSQDLANLFSRKINLSNDGDHETNRPSQELVISQQDNMQEENPIQYSISQHYHHSAHVAQNANQAHGSFTPAAEFPSAGLSIYQTLAQHNIPPSSLRRSQLTLFEQADNDQRSRLIQLWSLFPPHSTRNGGQTLVDECQGMTMEQEEKYAWLHQRNLFDEHREDERKQGGRSHSTRAPSSEGDLQATETYITTGYEQLAQRDYEEQQNRALPADLSTSAGLIFDGRYNQVTDNIHQQHDWQHNRVEHQLVEFGRGAFEQTGRLQLHPQQIVTRYESKDEEML